MLYSKNKNRKIRALGIIAVWFFAIVCLTTLVVGQEESQSLAVLGQVGATAEVTDQDAEETLDAQGLNDLHLKKDMTIKDALRTLALRFQKNIVPTATVDGQITVTDLYGVTFEEALQAVIGTNKYDVQGNFIMVYTAEEFEQIKANKRRMESRIFTLYYISAEDAKELLTPVLSDSGSIAATKAPEVGVSSGDELSVQPGGNSMSLYDSLIMKDYPENVTEAESLLAQIDVKPLQVLVEATILSVTLTEGMDFGIDLNLMAGTNLDGTAATETIVAEDNIDRGDLATSPIESITNITNGTPLETSGFATAGGNGLRIGISTGEVRVLITALEAVTDVTVLANPKILALNKQVGSVFIGKKIGYREGDVETGGGGTQRGNVEFLDTGTKLSFRPYIANDGYIRMDIYPKDSSFDGKDADGIPQETTAELSANIMVKDGQTAVIGGLFRDKVVSSKRQVPLLGDIPILGELFKGSTDQTVRQEVIILLTPHIIDTPTELEGDKRAADLERKRLAARDGLHFLGVARLAEDSYSKAVTLYSGGDAEAALCELNWTLHLRPTYFEALRLRERIILETSDDSAEAIERVMLGAIEREESQNWIRR